jgi:hypothetical protein
MADDAHFGCARGEPSICRLNVSTALRVGREIVS